MKMRKIAKSAKCCSVHVKRPESLQNFSQIILLAQFLAHVKVQQLAVRKCSQNSNKIPGSSKTGSKLGLPKPTLPDEKRGKVGHDCNPILVDREFHLRLPRLYFSHRQEIDFWSEAFCCRFRRIDCEISSLLLLRESFPGRLLDQRRYPCDNPQARKEQRGEKKPLFSLQDFSQFYL